MSIRRVIPVLTLSLLAVACGTKGKRLGEQSVPSGVPSSLGNVDAKGIIFVGGTPQDLQHQPRVKFGNVAPRPVPVPRPE
jgi:hypothetical protein